MIKEFGRSPTRSENVYFPNNEQALIAVFTAVFYFTHVEHNLIKFKLFNNWSVQAVYSISECAMWNSIKPIKFAHLWKLASQSKLNKDYVIQITKACMFAFMKARNTLVVWCREKKKNKVVKMYFLKPLLKIFW